MKVCLESESSEVHSSWGSIKHTGLCPEREGGATGELLISSYTCLFAAALLPILHHPEQVHTPLLLSAPTGHPQHKNLGHEETKHPLLTLQNTAVFILYLIYVFYSWLKNRSLDTWWECPVSTVTMFGAIEVRKTEGIMSAHKSHKQPESYSISPAKG